MFSRLLTTATRCISKSNRKIAKCPVKGGEKLTSNSLCLFVKKNYKKGSGNNMAKLAKLRNQYKGLSKGELAKYQNVAKANRRKVAARTAVFKQRRMSSYILFVKRNYASIAKKLKATGPNKILAVTKAISKQWKAIGAKGQAKYAAAAAQIRKAAVKQSDAMIAKYSA